MSQFNHSLLSIYKLAKDKKCNVIFRSNDCIIIDSITKATIGIRVIKKELYYLNNEKVKVFGSAMNDHKSKEIDGNVTRMKGVNQYALWNPRLGYASLSKS